MSDNVLPKPTKKWVSKSGSKRKDYINKLTKNLRKWDEELEGLEKKRDQKVTALRKNLTRRINILREKRADMQGKIEQLEEAGGDTFETLGKDIELIWKDLRDGFRSIQKALKK